MSERHNCILVVSHEATRTGAPRIAIQVQEALREVRPEQIVTVLRAGGPLVDEFRAGSDRLVREPLRRTRTALRRLALTRRVADRLEGWIAMLMLRRLRPRVAYLNTVKSACYVRPALRQGVRVILHVHELEPLASSTLRRYRLEGLYDRVRLVACSDAAGANLALITGVPREQIETIPSVVDGATVVTMASSADVAPQPSLVVGACGSAEPRKGVDLWLEMADRVLRALGEVPVRFRWVGRIRDDEPSKLARSLGIDDAVEFTGEVADPYRHLRRMDVFTMSSRQDPFPLVVLEAMALGRPVVAFELDGVREQVGDAGVLVPPGDVEALADSVVRLLCDEDERRRLGAAAQRRVHEVFGIRAFRSQVVRVVDAEVGPAGDTAASQAGRSPR